MSVRNDYRQHRLDWEDCTACPFHHTASRKVFARGKLPCQVLFIGEAPGQTEDDTGLPFVGRAGKVLDQWITRLQAEVESFTFAVTNIVLCYPGKDETGKFNVPLKEHAEACSDRLSEFLEIANPKLVVLLGKVADKHFVNVRLDRVIALPHPSFVLRSGGLDSLVGKRALLQSVSLFKEHLRG